MAFWDFPRYVPKAEKQARAAKKLEQLKKKRDMKPVILNGSSLARTWWGKAWNRNLEGYADYSNRIGRGRSYVRCGAVLDLQISGGEARALVQGSRSKPYEILIKIRKLNTNTWQQIKSSCAGMLESLQKLLAGNFPKELGEIFMQRETGLFPSPKEISFECSCPDWASMCKHVAATLYGVGARLDEDPSLFFTLRGVETGDLVSRAALSKADSLLRKASTGSSRIIHDADLSAVFGIDLEETGDSSAECRKGETVQKPSGRRTKSKKVKEDQPSTAMAKPKRSSSATRSTIKPDAKAVKKKTVKA